MILEPEDIEALSMQGTETLAIWWCQLNRGGRPRELPNQEDVRTEKEVGLRNTRRWQAMVWIDKKIGIKECLRVWNAERMSREEFEMWWSNMR